MTFPDPDRLAIPVAKGPLVRFFVTSLLGVAGCVFILSVVRGTGPFLDSAFRVFAVVGIAFCALTALFAGRRLFDPAPGLILDREGLVDNSNALAAGRVRWDEIREIRLTRSGAQRFLTVVVDDPRRFIDRGNAVRRRVLEANHRKAGSPVNITARTLRIPFEELVERTSEFYQRFGKAE